MTEFEGNIRFLATKRLAKYLNRVQQRRCYRINIVCLPYGCYDLIPIDNNGLGSAIAVASYYEGCWRLL